MTLPALKESHKIYIMLALLIGASYLTYYYHVILGTDIIFTHLFYIPIALACIWWKRWGIVVALFFGAMLLTSHAFFISNFPLIHDVFRSLMFVAAAVVVALLSEQVERANILYKTVADSSHTGIYIVQDGKFRYLNRNAARHAGYAAEDMMRMDPLTVVHPDDRKRVKENAFSMLRGKHSTPYEYRIIDKDGGIRYLMETVTPVEYQGHRAVLGNVVDITDRKRAEDELRLSEERYRTILRDIEDGYHEVDLAGSFIFFNESFRKIMGYPQEELLGMNYKQYAVDRDNAKKVLEVYNGIYKTGKPVHGFDWDIIRKDGERRTVEVSVSLIRNTEGRPEGFRGIVRDITERKRHEEEIRKLSITDQLTGLYNRRGVIALAEQQMKTANRAKRQMMLVFIDIDGMKWINDALGHKEGDRALLDTANILRQTFRESDIIARMGGDEFAVLAIDIADMTPEILSDRLEQIIAVHNTKVTRPYRLSMSWGAALYDPDYLKSLDQLMSEADELMYLRKKAKLKNSA